jgi:hypothetical protein
MVVFKPVDWVWVHMRKEMLNFYKISSMFEHEYDEIIRVKLLQTSY